MQKSSSSAINAEIYNLAPALFQAVQSAVMESGTAATSPAIHEANKSKLKEAVAQVLSDAIPKELDHRGLWQMIWPRIVYAGTRSSKATTEIKSMRTHVPLFRDMDNYAAERYIFDENEWLAFSEKWKGRLKNKWQKTRWIELSKHQQDWNPGTDFTGAKTTREVWELLTKDEAAYPGLKFSANTGKVAKYLQLADFLDQHRAAGHHRPLDYYLDGHAFDEKHLTGEPWVQERLVLGKVRQRLSAQVGKLTALHTMMDLGLKTIKPDRVMTYLFSQLGWLQTLPHSMAKDKVLEVYLNESVIEEMTIRADVFAAALSHAGHAQAHRLLDIWLVKYGQEPEKEFGITVNLQARGEGIRSVLDRCKKAGSQEVISAEAAARMWPAQEFLMIARAGTKPGARVSTGSRVQKLSRPQAEQLFMHQWRLGRETLPHIYPTHIDNRPKEGIFRKIERHMDPEEAFLSVLLPEDDPVTEDLPATEA